MKRPVPVLHYAWVHRPGSLLLSKVIGLYREAGWWEGGDAPARMRRMIAGSHCFLSARADGRIVAMGRAIGDKTSDAYIQDLFVLPEYRGRGVGAQIVRRLARRLRQDGLGWIGLVAADGSWPFYAKLGFRRMARHDAMRLHP